MTVPQLASGMTLRDWFAGQALSGFAANKEFLDALSIQADQLDLTHEAALAKACFQQADAMLAARGDAA